MLRILLKHLLLLLTLFLVFSYTSCGKAGNPSTPMPKIPQAVSNLKAEILCEGVELRFSPPTSYVGDKPIAEPLSCAIYREIEPTVAKKKQQAKPVRIALLNTADLGNDYHLGETITYTDKNLTLPDINQSLAEKEAPKLPTLRYYVLTWIKKKKPSEPSNKVEIGYSLPPTLPKGFTATSTPNGLKVAWDVVTLDCQENELTQDVLYEIREQGSPPSKAVTVEQPEYLDRDVTDNTQYSYLVVAKSGEARSQPAETPLFTYIDTFPPEAPRNIIFSAGQSSVSFLWEPNVEADFLGYNVYRREEGGNWEKLNQEPLTANSFVDNTIVKAQRYQYYFTTLDSSRQKNESTPSEILKVTGR